MRAIITGFIISVLTCIGLFAQVPDGFNYQAIARDAANVLANTDLSVKVSIQTGDAIPVILWEEDHSVTTNDYGLFTLMIGDLEATGYAGTVNSFAEIDWTQEPYYIRTRVYYSLEWHDMGAQQLLSVPYAMFAKHSENDLSSPFMFNGDSVYIMKNFSVGSDKPMKANFAVVGANVDSEDALFEVRRQDGQPVFSVYNGGVRIYVDDTPSDKAVKGGFAIGGFDQTKGVIKEYMRLTPDSIRMNINEPSGKASKGGFAIGSFSAKKTAPSSLMHLTPDNYFIGHESGINNADGLYNTFFGFNAGFFNSSGSRGIFMGYNAGYNNLDGNTNTFIGNYSGFTNMSGTENVFIGDSAGYSNETGATNVFIGAASGKHNIDGNLNVFIGDEAGLSNTHGFRNTFVGTYAGWTNTTGHSNVFLGPVTGVYNTTGEGNIFIGRSAGYYNETGSDNVFLGKWSGIKNIDGSNNVFLGTLSGRSLVSGYDNIFIGSEAGFSSDTSNANIFIGFFAGHNDSTTYGNVLIGDHSGEMHTEGDGNVFLGTSSGRMNIDGRHNIFIGFDAGWFETGSDKLYIENSGANKDTALIYGDFVEDYLQLNANVNITRGLQLNGTAVFGNDPASLNTFLGDSAAYSFTDGYWNTFIGSRAGYSNLHGNMNTFIGASAGKNNQLGENNVFLGRTSGRLNIGGNANTYLGASAGYYNEYGRNNVAVGRLAGLRHMGDSSIFIGYRSGLDETESNRLYIESSDAAADSALIYGEFDADKLWFNAEVNIRDLLVLKPRDDAPDPAEQGTIYYDVVLNKLRVYDGSIWHDLW